MEQFLHLAVIASTPLLFAILGELFIEKSGVLNLGVEGVMMFGAICAFMVSYNTHNPSLAILSSCMAGAGVCFIFMVLTIFLRSSQVVSGLALTIFATGLANYFGKPYESLNVPPAIIKIFSDVKIPIMGDIPFMGTIFFNQNILVYFSYICAIIIFIYLYKTRMGLYATSVGENPKSADTAGINVSRYRAIHVLIGGALCGLGGAVIPLTFTHTWQANITTGRGWVAIALVIFAGWNPLKAVIFAYIFGVLSSIGNYMQANGIYVSQYLLDMLPFIATIVIMILTSIFSKGSKGLGPKALGVNYFREDR